VVLHRHGYAAVHIGSAAGWLSLHLAGAGWGTSAVTAG
jgi:hypothetical protein